MTAGTPHQALYRRWRAQTFSEIVGQEAVVTTLRNAVTTGRVSHAILFTGPRGTGKTSLARILAKALNCQDLQPNADPCDRCTSCVAIREGTTLDIVEMDAASNRGIEAIRDLRERLEYPPGELRRKVYILDEAHQITKDAWNALLKSLEEPPDFVVFMFASTHPQEFPPAILSRLQRFDVRRLTIPEITGKLERILTADGREADPEAVALVAHLAAGGMRDAESILDQLLASTGGRIETDAVRDLLGLADADAVDRFIAALSGGDAAVGITLLDGLEDRGRDLKVFLDQVVDALRERLVAGMAAGTGVDAALVDAAQRLGAIDPSRPGPGGLRLQLELALLAPVANLGGRPQPVAAAAPSAGERVDARPGKPRRPEAQTVAEPTRPGTPTGAEPAASAEPPASAEPAAPAEAAAATSHQPAEPAASSAEAAGATPHRRAAPAATSEAPAEPPAAAEPPAEPAAATSGPRDDDLDRLRHGWAEVIAIISKSPPLKPLIEACRPIGVEGSIVTLGFPEEKGFLREAAERKRAGIETGVGQFLGHPVGVRCVVSNLDLLPPLPDDAEAARILAEAQRIFADDRADIGEIS